MLFIKRVVSILALTFPLPLFAESYLNGIAPYKHLNKEYYLGALYLTAPQTKEGEILSDTAPQRMIIKVTARSWSLRKFAEFWRNDLILNNDISKDAVLTNQLMAFTNFPKQSLAAGDEIIIQYTPDNGSEVFFNSDLVIHHQSKEFFKALLKSWIGAEPHSQFFKEEMLGNETYISSRRIDWNDRFKNSVVADDRIGLVTKWKTNENAAKLAIIKAQEKIAQEKKEEERAKRAAEAKRVQLEKERKRALALAEKRRKEAELAKKKANNSEERKASLKAQEEAKAALKAQREAERKAAELAKRQKQIRLQAAKNQREKAALQYAYDQYRWEVTRDIYNRVNYPTWAEQFNLKGIVKADLLVNRSGELAGITNIEPKDAGMLGDELQSAIRKAAPFKPFPANIVNSQMTVSVSYEFTLDQKNAKAPPPPTKPAGLIKDLTSEQKTRAWQDYQNNVIAELDAAIVYPDWAKDLRQQGVVSAEVTVQPDGSISKVKIKKRTRHLILNQEVEQAMERIGSVDPFPGWVKEKKLTVLIEHNFKL